MSEPSDTRQRRTIVVADDDANMRRFYKTTLQSAGFNVFAADDGDACLTILTRVQPALILLDIDMPRITGFVTLENIRRLHPQIQCPVIFSTVHQTEDSVTRAKSLGAMSFLVKPITADVLLDRVEACLRRRRPGYAPLKES